ncbi:PKD domain-containing protein [Inhella sp.]|uniref:PKD domain-containing protein n=1 Tax=Inhella sp. TaxID=1921806 RepID=UPI0035B0D96F
MNPDSNRWPACLLALLLSACGGGGDSPPPPVTPTVPLSVELQLPERTEAGEALSLSTSLGGATGTLSYQWDFGDGQRSTEAQPSHRYERPGRYTVSLTVQNGQGGSASAQRSLHIGHYKRLEGRDCSGVQLSGWCWLQPASSARWLATPQVLDARTAIAAGELGQLVHSRDGGRSWGLLSPPAATKLVEVRAQGEQLIVADAAGRLYRSSDGGRSWAARGKLPAPLTDSLGGRPRFWWLGNERIWANVIVPEAAPGQSPYRSVVSQDGGLSWQTLALRLTQVERNGWAWGADTDFADDLQSVNRWAYLSRDGGLSTEPMPLAAGRAVMAQQVASDGTIHRITLLRSFDSQRPDLAARLKLELSRDSGRSFEAQPTRWPQELLDGDVSEVRMDAEGNALAIGANHQQAPSRPWIATSRDGGRSWSELQWPQDGAFYRGALLDAQSLLLTRVTTELGNPDGRRAVTLQDSTGRQLTLQAPGELQGPDQLVRLGVDGLLLDYQGRWVATPDFGKTWVPLPGHAGYEEHNPYRHIRALAFTDARNGLVLSGQIGRSTDGGRSWQAGEPLSDAWNPPGASLQFVAGGLGWAKASDGGLWRSRNAGASWERIWTDALTDVVRADLFDAQHGWALTAFGNPTTCGQGCVSYHLERTRDGGSSWTRLAWPASGPASLLALGPQVLLVNRDAGPYTAATLHRSEDGGQTWQQLTVAGLEGSSEGLLRRDPQGQAWLLDRKAGRLWRSSDLGRSWQAMALPTDLPLLNDLHWAANGAGWIVGDEGLILATRDGGQTWRRQDSGTGRSLLQAFAADSETVWILGESNTILASATGGE